MDLGAVIDELKTEGERIALAIAALTGRSKTATAGKRRVGAPKPATSKTKKRGGITAAGRKRLSILMKKRWAERKKKGS